MTSSSRGGSNHLCHEAGLPARPEPRVAVAVRDELVVGGDLDEPAVLHHRDAVGALGGREAVRDRDHRAPARELRRAPARPRLRSAGRATTSPRRARSPPGRRARRARARRAAARPTRAGRRASARRWRDRPAAPRSARARRSPQRLAHLVVRRVRAREPDVVGDRPGEEMPLLRHEDDPPPQVVERRVAQVDAAERAPARRSGRRRGRAAWRASTCRRRSRRRARDARPARP